MSDQTTAGTAQPEKKLYVKQNVYPFFLENGKKPKLLPESDILVVLDGTITTLRLKELFWGYTKFPNPKIYVSDAEIKGYTLLQECFNPEKGEIFLDKKLRKFSLHDPVTNQNFKIGPFSLSMCAWFDDNDYSQADKNKFGTLIYGAKPMTRTKIEEIQSEAEKSFKNRTETTLKAELEAQQAEQEEEEREGTFDELLEQLLSEGYTVIREGNLAFFNHTEEAERLFRVEDKEGIKYTELDLPKTEDDMDIDKQGRILYHYQDGDQRMTLVLDPSDDSIKARKYVAPEPDEEEEEATEEPTEAPQGSTGTMGPDDTGVIGTPGAQGEEGKE